MKMNFAVFKKGKPIVWIIGAVVLFGFFYWFANRGAASSVGGGVNVYSQGPSDTAIASSAALSAKQSDNSAQVAIATLAYQGNLAQVQAQADVGKYIAALDAATQDKYLDAQLKLAVVDAEYGIATATVAANVTRDMGLMQMQMFNSQMQANASMFKDQMQAATFSVLASQIGNVKANDRDNAFAMLTAAVTGKDTTYVDRTSGSFSTGSKLSPVSAGSGGGSGVPNVPVFGLIGGMF